MRLWTILVAMVFLCPTPGSARDGQESPLDAIILMDDSGSMRTTDPLKLRFSAFSLFMRLLREDDALGLVRFDDAATVVVPLHPMATEKDRQALEQALTTFSTRGRYTNIYAALKTALHHMQQRGREDAVRAVILISDGLMDVNPAAGVRNADALRQLHETLLPAYQAAQVKVVTLALSPGADRSLLQAIAAMTGGSFFYTPQAGALSQALLDIFTVLKSPETIQVTGQRVAIDSSVKETTFFIMLDTSKQDVALLRPDGVKLDKARRDPATRWFIGKDYVLVTIQEPLAGEWSVDSAGQRLAKVIVLTDIRLEVTHAQRPSFTGQDVQISARLVASGPLGAPSLPLADLAFVAEVVPPAATAGIQRSLSRRDEQRTGAAIGQWYDATLSLPSTPGEYRGRVSVVAQTFSREKAFAFWTLSEQDMGAAAATAEVSGQPSESETLARSLQPPHAAEEGGGEGAGPAEDTPVASSSVSKVLRLFVMAHGVLLVLGAAVLLGRRLRRGIGRAQTEHNSGDRT